MTNKDEFERKLLVVAVLKSFLRVNTLKAIKMYNVNYKGKPLSLVIRNSC